jgi:hypothetical protein
MALLTWVFAVVEEQDPRDLVVGTPGVPGARA